jgi:hypothetical protein
VTLTSVLNLWPPFGGGGAVIEPPSEGSGPTWFAVEVADAGWAITQVEDADGGGWASVSVVDA